MDREGRAATPEEPPDPPAFLVDRVAGFDDSRPDFSWRTFDRSGQQSVREIKMALAGLGKTLGDFACILDFGCGPGRVLRWLRSEALSSEIHACDVDEQAIAWCRENLPGMRFTLNDPEPPLPYADETFDLVLNHSVFTHIDERMQDLWLAELRRVMKPGGLALLSLHGPKAFGLTENACRFEGDTPEILRKELERDGILYVTSDAFVGSSFPDYYHTTFHAPWYVFEHWSQWFSVRGYLQGADLDLQDIILLERDDPEARIWPVAAAGSHRNSTEETPDADTDAAPIGSLADVNADRFPPVVAAALENMGRRVTRLEGAVADLLSNQ